MDLTTRYLGLTLKNPLVAGAGPFGRELDAIRRLEDLGAGAVVLPSLFEEQIRGEQEAVEQLLTASVDAYAEALTYFPAQVSYGLGPERYLELVRRAAAAVDIPVIASLNGVTSSGWVEHARQLEQAGANAIELNIYFIPSDLTLSGRDVEERYLEVLRAVRQATQLPISLKIGPYFSAIGYMARELDEAGADGLVLFNRFYQPDIDLTRLAMVSSLDLSRASEIRLPLLWIGVLAGRLKASLAASTGVESVDEVVKYLLVGADVVMATSALLRHGLSYMKVLMDELQNWLAERDLDTLETIRGRMSHRNLADPVAFERANYIRILQGYSTKR